jgi:hypothetical protein
MAETIAKMQQALASEHYREANRIVVKQQELKKRLYHNPEDQDAITNLATLEQKINDEIALAAPHARQYVEARVELVQNSGKGKKGCIGSLDEKTIFSNEEMMLKAVTVAVQDNPRCARLGYDIAELVRYGITLDGLPITSKVSGLGEFSRLSKKVKNDFRELHINFDNPGGSAFDSRSYENMLEMCKQCPSYVDLINFCDKIFQEHGAEKTVIQLPFQYLPPYIEELDAEPYVQSGAYQESKESYELRKQTDVAGVLAMMLREHRGYYALALWELNLVVFSKIYITDYHPYITYVGQIPMPVLKDQDRLVCRLAKVNPLIRMSAEEAAEALRAAAGQPLHMPMTAGSASPIKKVKPVIEMPSQPTVIAEKVEQHKECIMCMDGDMTMMMMPCRHACYCIKCAIENKLNECMFCRQPIHKIVPIQEGITIFP